MNAVAYCRVSTNKDEQIDSLQAQQKFFLEYASRNHFHLTHIYADEGKSGTKIKNRTQLLNLLRDAEQKSFDAVLIKDVSRLARNTVDFLTSIRKLKSLGINIFFVNYDLTSSDSSEFMLTMLSAIAQEESANTSKRVKFGKKLNAENGRVPNLVYGYTKIPGDYFDLHIEPFEADVIRRIFRMYTEEELGAGKIAQILNSEKLKTKRGCLWSQNAVSRILTNELYVGNIINGKQEVEDFLTGKRKTKAHETWFIVKRPDLAVIDEATFAKASAILNERKFRFHITGERRSEKHSFSKLIKCSSCGSTFRRSVRHYQNTYIRWICSGRNAQGTASCPNNTTIEESALIGAIRTYILTLVEDHPKLALRLSSELKRMAQTNHISGTSQKELRTKLTKLKKSKDKYMELFTAEIIDLNELQEKCAQLSTDISDCEEKLLVLNKVCKINQPNGNIPRTFIQYVTSFLSDENITYSFVSGFIEKIETSETRNVRIYIKNLSRLYENVPLTDNGT